MKFKKILSFFLIAVTLCCVAVVGGSVLFSDRAPDSEDLLYYVGPGHSLPKSFVPEKMKTLDNGEQVASVMMGDLQDMFDYMRNVGGMKVTVRSGYRSYEWQENHLEKEIEELMQEEGISRRKAKAIVTKTVSEPGESEHQLGLGIDINGIGSEKMKDKVYSWLSKNAHNYGFICRYPANKTEITGKSYERWHYRYVGKDAAKEIYERGICLEEYLGID